MKRAAAWNRVGSRPFPGIAEVRSVAICDPCIIWDTAMKRAAAWSRVGSRPFPGIAEVRSAAIRLA